MTSRAFDNVASVRRLSRRAPSCPFARPSCLCGRAEIVMGDGGWVGHFDNRRAQWRRNRV
eukprot:262087-Pleurochrysis_carterae.AAC.2